MVRSDASMIIAIRRAMFEARRRGVINQSDQARCAVTELLKTREDLTAKSASTLVSDFLSDREIRDRENINDVIEYLDDFERWIKQELQRMGCQVTNETAIDYHIGQFQENNNTRIKKRDRRLNELFTALSYIKGVHDFMQTGSIFTSLKYALRVVILTLGVDAEIGERSRLKGAERFSSRRPRQLAHQQWAERDMELKQKFPKSSANRRAQMISNELGRAVGWEAVRKAVRRIRGQQG